MELLTPPKLIISTHVVVGVARLEASQLGLVEKTWVSIAKVNGWRATHITSSVCGAISLCVCACVGVWMHACVGGTSCSSVCGVLRLKYCYRYNTCRCTYIIHVHAYNIYGAMKKCTYKHTHTMYIHVHVYTLSEYVYSLVFVPHLISGLCESFVSHVTLKNRDHLWSCDTL